MNWAVVAEVMNYLSTIAWVFSLLANCNTLLTRLYRKLEGITELHRRTRALLDNLPAFVEEVDLNVEQELMLDHVLIGYPAKPVYCCYDTMDTFMHRSISEPVFIFQYDRGEAFIVGVPGIYHSQDMARQFVEERQERIERGRVMQSAVAEGTPLSLSSGAL